MAQEVRGVVARSKGAPVTVETINVPDPGPGEAVVQVQACGVCHTDLHYREGGINDEFPFLLGHEAAGVVEAVGPDVTGVAPGDFVVLNWRAVCGECRACRKGKPGIRDVDEHPAAVRGIGGPVHPAAAHDPVHQLGQGGMVHEHQLGELAHGAALLVGQHLEDAPLLDARALLRQQAVERGAHYPVGLRQEVGQGGRDGRLVHSYRQDEIALSFGLDES